MRPGAPILLVVIVSVVVVVAVTLTVFRFVIRRLGIEQLVQEGIVMTENGIEYPRFFFMGSCKTNYEDIERVELVPFPKNFLWGLRFGSVLHHGPKLGLFSGTVVIKFKRPGFAACYLCHPSDPAAFVEELKSRIEQRRASTVDS